MMKFEGFVFDFDGTITEKGVHHPDKEMVEVLARVAQDHPIACCTGRQLESFVRHGLNYFTEGAPKELLPGMLRNLHLMAENGAIGYFYNEDSENFEEFYRSSWPSELIERKNLMDLLNEAVKDYGSVYYEAHQIVVVLRTKLHYLKREERDVNEVYGLSEKLYEIAKAVLYEINPGYEEFVHIGNSGIGVVIGPAKGDKNFGVKQFGEYLVKVRGIQMGTKFRELLIAGDRPQKEGNDHYLLNGEFGTPYTVGTLLPGEQYPLAVFDDQGKRLMHAAGTKFLLTKHFL